MDEALAKSLRDIPCARYCDLEAIKADIAISALLDVEAGDPLFLFHTVGRDEDGVAVEYSIATYRGENNSFEFNVSRTD